VRAELLGATRLLDEVALDKYSFLRDAYLSRRLDAGLRRRAPAAKPGRRFDDEPDEATPASRRPPANRQRAKPASGPDAEATGAA
jgi:phospholipid-binding lipoprotein MlaA